MWERNALLENPRSSVHESRLVINRHDAVNVDMKKMDGSTDPAAVRQASRSQVVAPICE